MLTANNSQKNNLLLFGVSIAILSFSLLAYEILIARLFSVILTYHYVFAIVSFAILGLGIGGMILRYWQNRILNSGLNIPASMFGLSICISILTIVKLPTISIISNTGLLLWIYFPLAIIPFVFAGITLASIFQKFSGHSSFLYGCDLVGASAGSLCAVALLDTFTVVYAIFTIAITAGISGLIFAISERKPFRSSIFSIIGILLILFTAITNIIGTDIHIAPSLEKDLYRILNNLQDKSEIVATRWSAFGRTDLARTANRGNNEMLLFIDGAAGTSMYNFDSVYYGSELRPFIMYNEGEYFPFYFLKNYEKENALVIGPGGGKDIVIALMGGVKSITGVEVNPDIVQIVKEFERFNGGIYNSFPNVSIIVQEGRNYLRTVKEMYDLIMIALPITKSSRSAESYALTENYLFTIESFKEYIDHLTPEGSLIFVAHSDYEIYRLIMIALAAFRENLISESDAMKHMYTIASWKTPTLVIRKRQFTPPEIEQIAPMIHQLGFDKRSFYLPFFSTDKTGSTSDSGNIPDLRNLDQFLSAISNGLAGSEEIIQSASLNIEPVTDDSPFFYKFEKGLPKPFRVFIAFLIALLGVLSIPIINGFKKLKIHQTNVSTFLIFLIIFFSLGMGFMLIEISLLQKLMLYIEHPTLAMTLLLFSLLVGMGLGSFSSRYIIKNLERAIISSSSIIVLMSLIYNVYLPDFFSLSLYHKLVVVLILVPFGFFIGIPFPLTIRLLQKYKLEDQIDWMWGINGIASVIGSTISIVIGMFLGFSYALIFGAGIYLFIGSIVYSFLRPKIIQ